MTSESINSMGLRKCTFKPIDGSTRQRGVKMPSEVVVLRNELAVLHEKNLRLREFCKNMLAVCEHAITSQAQTIEMEKRRADRVQEEVNSLTKRLQIQQSWNGYPHLKTKNM